MLKTNGFSERSGFRAKTPVGKEFYFMGRVRTDDLRPGMVPRTEVSTHNGRVLIQPGQPLTEKHLQIIKSWGVTMVDIDDEDFSVDSDLPFLPDAGAPEAERKALEALFQHTDREHPAIRELYAYRLRKSAGCADGGVVDER
ncbi:MAG: hypothetical protein JSU88_12635 [Nitrospinaceae bacterium]|nr:MAG: hypothetical protein JSU88_12635 [Nitrospinaceae bacterium]